MDPFRHRSGGPAQFLAVAAMLFIATTGMAQTAPQTTPATAAPKIGPTIPPRQAAPATPPSQRTPATRPVISSNAGGVSPKAGKPSPPKQRLTPKEQADGILGKRVYGIHGEDMGLVTDVLVDRTGQPIAVVIDFGGFLGVGTRKIAIDWQLMQFHPGDVKKPVTLSLQKAQLQAAPQYEPGKSAKILGASVPAKPPIKPPSSEHGGK